MADAAIVLQAIAGYDAADITSVDIPVADYVSSLQQGPKSFRVGVPRGYFFDDLDPEVSAAVEHALSGIEMLVAQVKEVQIDVPTDRTLQAAEAYAYHAENVAKSTDRYQAETVRRIRSGEKVTAAEYIQQRRELEQARRNIRRVFAEVDVLVMPTIPMPAPAIADLRANPDELRPAELKLLRNTRRLTCGDCRRSRFPAASRRAAFRLDCRLPDRTGGKTSCCDWHMPTNRPQRGTNGAA